MPQVVLDKERQVVVPITEGDLSNAIPIQEDSFVAG